MRLLLDTHALLWWLADDARLAQPARDAIADPMNDAFVSAASAWEIAIKARLGKVTMPDDLAEQRGDSTAAQVLRAVRSARRRARRGRTAAPGRLPGS